MLADHARLRELFLAACDLPESEQSVMVDEHCADDPDLRRELKLLLRKDARKNGIFADDKITEGIQFQCDTVVETVLPKHVGRYQVKRILGEGGMGVVYLAEQQNPRREVAIKVIRSGLADKQTIARFEAERQALSMMDHPNIARVLDVGETDDRTPYFVMELVQGDPITKYCDMNKLALNQRLELFADACDAIQHAHHKGIIHRDLKPSNILVDIHDGKPRIKVIDFGLAKALEHQTKLTEKTVFTEFGKVVGTVQYMSPEQARLDSVDIDTRTDIYSLGVILYELLTGSTPLEKDSVQAQALMQVLEVIREKDPQRPSDRLSSSLDERDSISELRQIQPAKLQQILRGELDWIIMRALEKDRTRRYASPNDFADDVRRYLNGEAVEARPPSGVYRLRKFVRKNRIAVGVFVGFLTLVCGASVAVFSYAVKADASAKRSDEILQIVADSFHAVNPESGSDAQMSAKDVLINAYEGLPESELDNSGKRKLLKQLNGSFSAIGETKLAIQTAEEWRASATGDLGPNHPDTMMSMNNLAIEFSKAGLAAEAIELFEQTLTLRQETLGPDHLDTLRTMNNLSSAYLFGGQIKEAIELSEQSLRIRQAELGPDHPDTLSSMHNLGNAYRVAGRIEEAIELDEQTLRLSQAKLGPDHPDTLGSMNGLAASYGTAGRTEEALKLFEKAYQLKLAKLGPDHPDTLAAMNNLAITYRIGGRTDESIKLHERSLELTRAKLGPNHRYTVGSMHNLAMGYDASGRNEEAIKLYEQTLQLRTATLGAEHPDTLSSRNNLAVDYRKTGRLADAIELDEGTLKLRQAKLGPDHPDTLTSMSNLALGYCDVGRIEEAITLGRESLSLRQTKLGRDHPVTIKWMGEFVWILATTEGMENGIDEALLGDLRTACEGKEDGELLNTLALAEYRLENFEEAIDAANASIEKLPPPPGPINLALLAMSHLRLNHEPEASEFREAFQQAMQTEEYKDDSDCQKFTAEVEHLFGAREEDQDAT